MGSDSRRSVILVIALLAAVAVAAVGTAQTEQTTFPANHLLHDYEPSADEQWDLDTAISNKGYLFAVWADARLLDADIRFTKSPDGSSWGDGVPNNDKVVNDDSAVGYDHLDPSITVDEKGKLFVVWLDMREPQVQLRMATSNNSGGIWTPGRRVLEVEGDISSPVIRWSSKVGLCLAYVLSIEKEGKVQTDIMFSRSVDGGETFSSPVVVNDNQGPADQTNPRMAVAGDGTVGIVWEDARNDDGTGSNIDIYLSLTRDGRNFSENRMVGSDENRDKQLNPDLAFSSRNDLMVVFQEYGLNGWRVRYSIGWSGSSRWDGSLPSDYQATTENISRVEQHSPRVSWGANYFAIAWTEKDLRDFVMVKTGYVSKEGQTVSGEHIVDNTISLGKFVKDPQIYIAQMYKETVSVHCYGERTNVFWLDCRTDPVPTNNIAEDMDPYSAEAIKADGMPLPPNAVTLRAKNVSWGSFDLEWSVPVDLAWKNLYVKLGEGTADEPNEFVYDHVTSDRLSISAHFDGLRPDTTYQVRAMVKDGSGRKAFSPPLHFRTLINNQPLFIFHEPDGMGDVSDQGFIIRWTARDDEDIADYELYYDNDLDPSDQVFLTSGNTLLNKGEGELYFNTSALPNGGYTINATMDDHVNPPVTIYSPAIIVQHRSVLVDHPMVLSCTVEGGRESAYMDAVVRVTFTKAMTASTISQESLYIIDGQTFMRKEGSITMVSSSEVEWRPRSWLSLGTKYTLLITPQALDMEGNALDGQVIGGPSSFSYAFMTRPVDGVPEVRSWAPQGRDVRLRPEIRVTFDRPMDPSSLGPATVLLYNPVGAGIPLTVSYDDQGPSLLAGCTYPLKANTTYSLKLSRDIRSAKGVGLGADLNWTFTTGSPDMSKDSDGDGVPDDLDLFPTDPTEHGDTDLDGIGDNKDLDDDNDGMPDAWELKYGLDPKNPKDADGDLDSDGKTNLQEFRDGTRPDRSEQEDEATTWLFIIIGSFILVVVVIITYTMVQRRKLEAQRLESEFFKDREE